MLPVNMFHEFGGETALEEAKGMQTLLVRHSSCMLLPLTVTSKTCRRFSVGSKSSENACVRFGHFDDVPRTHCSQLVAPAAADLQAGGQP